jgi:hypothetical protein
MDEKFVIASVKGKYVVGIKVKPGKEKELKTLVIRAKNLGNVEGVHATSEQDFCGIRFRIKPYSGEKRRYFGPLERAADALLSEGKEAGEGYKVSRPDGDYLIVSELREGSLSRLSGILERQTELLEAAVRENNAQISGTERVEEYVDLIFRHLPPSIEITRKDLNSRSKKRGLAKTRAVISLMLKGMFGSKITDKKISEIIGTGINYQRECRNKFNFPRLNGIDYSNVSESVEKVVEAYEGRVVLRR